MPSKNLPKIHHQKTWRLICVVGSTAFYNFLHQTHVFIKLNT